MSKEIKEAYQTISNQLNKDESYLISVYCVFAVTAQDFGIGYEKSQEFAQHLLKMLFSADSTKLANKYIENYKKIKHKDFYKDWTDEELKTGHKTNWAYKSWDKEITYESMIDRSSDLEKELKRREKTNE